MKKLLIATPILLTLFSTHSFAAAVNLEGVQASLGFSMVGNTSKLKYSDPANFAQSSYNIGRTSFVGVVNLAYLKTVSEKWLLGVGSSYDLNGSETGRYSTYRSDQNVDYRAVTKSKNHYSIYFQPTYALSDIAGVFAKLGYHSTNVKITDSDGQIISGFGESSYSRTVSGVGIGGGLMTFVDKNIFLKVELEYVRYQKINVPRGLAGTTLNYGLSTTSGTVSAGYRF